jgi:hypothetical protein
MYSYENAEGRVEELLVEICFDEDDEVTLTELEYVFQQLDQEAICRRLMDALSKGGFNDFNRVLHFLAGLKLSKNIAGNTKKAFCTAFAGEIFSQCPQGTLSLDDFKSFLLELTENETIERMPEAFLTAYLNNLSKFVFCFEKESRQFERILYSIHVLKLALYVKDFFCLNQSLQIILPQMEQNSTEQSSDNSFDNEQTSALCSSMRSLWESEEACYKKMIQWAGYLYEVPENEALAACFIAFRELDETDSTLTAIKADLNENPYNEDIGDQLIDFFRVFRILFNQYQTWDYDASHELHKLVEKIRMIINDTRFFHSNKGFEKARPAEIQSLADLIQRDLEIDLDNINSDQIKILLRCFFELSTVILKEPHKRSYGLFEPKPSAIQTERVHQFLTILSNPDKITPGALLEQLNEFHPVKNNNIRTFSNKR